MKCKYCGKEINNLGSLRNHELHQCKLNANIIKPNIPNKSICSKRNLTRKWVYDLNNDKVMKHILSSEIDTFLQDNPSFVLGYPNWFKDKISLSIRKAYEANKLTGRSKDDISEQDRRNKISKTMKEHKCGGYRNGSGYGKHGKYKGFVCDSSWELAFLIYHLEHNLYIERCKEKRTYTYNGVEHKYTPDFITDKGVIEIKGYTSKQWQAKYSCNKDVIVLFEDDMKIYLDYVVNKYGSDFIKLYE